MAGRRRPSPSPGKTEQRDTQVRAAQGLQSPCLESAVQTSKGSQAASLCSQRLRWHGGARASKTTSEPPIPHFIPAPPVYESLTRSSPNSMNPSDGPRLPVTRNSENRGHRLGPSPNIQGPSCATRKLSPRVSSLAAHLQADWYLGPAVSQGLAQVLPSSQLPRDTHSKPFRSLTWGFFMGSTAQSASSYLPGGTLSPRASCSVNPRRVSDC